MLALSQTMPSIIIIIIPPPPPPPINNNSESRRIRRRRRRPRKIKAYLTASQGVFEAVAQKDDQRQALTHLVGTSARAGGLCAEKRDISVCACACVSECGVCLRVFACVCEYLGFTHIGTRQLVKHPVARGIKPLQVLLGTTSHLMVWDGV